MILRSILHSTWIEWREQRSNLLGLWAGLLLLILAMALFGGFDLVTDAVAPIAFALLGYLGFVLAIMPRIFSGSAQRSTEALQQRCPAGIHGNFLGKALFLNLAMALSALLPALTVLALIYAAAPRTYEILMNVRFGKGDPGLSLALFAAPLMLMTWRLPARWVLVVVPLTVALIFGAISLGVLGVSTSDSGYRLFGYTVFIGFLVLPWLTTWSSFTMIRGATKLRRSLVGLGFVCLAVSPALGLGLHGYVRNGFSFVNFDPESQEFFIQHAYLSPDGTQAYLTSNDRNNPRNLRALFEPNAYFRNHAIRVDLATGAFTHWADQQFLVPTSEGLQESGRATYPHVSGLILHEPTGDPSDAFQAVDLVTHKLTPIDPERIVVDYRVNAEAMGLGHPWRTRNTEVGLGVCLWARSKRNAHKTALYDSSRSKVFYGDELPFTFGTHHRRLLVLPGRWLIGPEQVDEPWMRFDPDGGTLDPIRGLVDGTSIGSALPDGKVIVCRGNQFSLYNVDEDTCESLLSIGGPQAGPDWTFWNPNGSLQASAPASFIQVSNKSYSPRPLSGQDDPVDTFLGHLNRDTNEIHWLPWSRQHRIVGAFDKDTLLIIQDYKRLIRFDLDTGEQELLFPRPSILE